ncbi:MAG: DUF4384 domain-containing protein, partial [Methylococcales bacterium]
MKTKKFLNLINITLAAALTLSFIPLVCHADALEEVPDTEKLVRVRTTTNPGQGNNNLSVELSTEQDSYRVNEAIRFKIRSNKEAFFYLFNIDPRTRKAVAILPNRMQSNRELRYPAASNWNVVPNKNLEFYSDRPGTER